MEGRTCGGFGKYRNTVVYAERGHAETWQKVADPAWDDKQQDNKPDQSEQQKNHYLFRIRRYGNVSLRQHRTVCAGKIRAAYSRCQRYCWGKNHAEKRKGKFEQYSDAVFSDFQRQSRSDAERQRWNWYFNCNGLHFRGSKLAGLRLSDQLWYSLESCPHCTAFRTSWPYRQQKQCDTAGKLLAGYGTGRLHQPEKQSRNPYENYRYDFNRRWWLD